MAQNMNNGQPIPTFDFIHKHSKSCAKILSVFNDEYDGGEYCQGLIVAREVVKLLQQIIEPLFGSIQNNDFAKNFFKGSNPIVASFLQ